MKRFVLALGLVALVVGGCGDDDGGPAPGSESQTFVPAADESARVASVVDGETLVLADGRRVSLLGIDAPQGTEACADEARSRLEELTVGKTVDLDVCQTPPAGQPVPQGGVTAYAVVPDEAFVNVEMLRGGFAQVRGTVSSCGGAAAQRRLERAQSEAQQARRGVFGTPPASCRATPPEPEPIGGPGPSPSPGASPSPSPGASPSPTP